MKTVVKKTLLSLAILFGICISVKAEDGHGLWLRLDETVREISCDDPNPGKDIVACNKKTDITNLAIRMLASYWKGGKVTLTINAKNKANGTDGYTIKSDANSAATVNAMTDKGILYAAFHLLRLQNMGESIANLSISEKPSYENRILNHWDNLDGTVERGYAGHSIFWRDGEEENPTVTEEDMQLWFDYATANASIGINGVVLNNVNASPRILSDAFITKIKAIADVFRMMGIKVYLSVNFASPQVLGGLETSDPLNKQVIAWWKNRIDAIYKLIPDFGGFLVKASSEGQPGPGDFGRSHAEGANMMADLLKPHKGIVMWRAFVYSANDSDRAKQAYQEFMPLDGQFHDNVIVQVKNGPIDFQPREPFSPLFGAMKKTSIMPEVQITQEYLGHNFQLVYLGTMWEEVLKTDTYQNGKGSTVARVTDGSIYPQAHTAIAGVANVGLDTNWCGHHFAQSNWYAFGRLAWNNNLRSQDIAREWVLQTFGTAQKVTDEQFKSKFVKPVVQMMMASREACVDYMMPLGLHHLFAWTHHYGPEPWCAPEGARADWLPSYYHKADAAGIGFDRSSTGSNAVSQYAEPLRSQFDNIETCPKEYLLWFHHAPWNFLMQDGSTLWQSLCRHYNFGVQCVRQFQTTWESCEKYIDAERFKEIQSKLRRHARDAQWWKDACILYFQQFSKQPIPSDVEIPANDLEDLMKIHFDWAHHN